MFFIKDFRIVDFTAIAALFSLCSCIKHWLKRDFPESSGSGGAFQPAESNADASQPGGLPTVRVNLGCFNCDIDQYMLSKIAHRKSLSRVIAKGVDEQDLHILTLSEVGGRERSETGDAP